MLGLALGHEACVGDCDPGSPCPQRPRVDVDAWCFENPGQCTTESGDETCDPRCELALGDTLTVPLFELGGAFAERRYILLHLANISSSDDLSLSTFNVTVNGTLGTHTLVRGNETSISFEPFPNEPTALEVQYESGPLEEATLGIYLHDRACEILNPGPPCNI
jgi:hypothetical protein